MARDLESYGRRRCASCSPSCQQKKRLFMHIVGRTLFRRARFPWRDARTQGRDHTARLFYGLPKWWVFDFQKRRFAIAFRCRRVAFAQTATCENTRTNFIAWPGSIFRNIGQGFLAMWSISFTFRIEPIGVAAIPCRKCKILSPLIIHLISSGLLQHRLQKINRSSTSGDWFQKRLRSICASRGGIESAELCLSGMVRWPMRCAR